VSLPALLALSVVAVHYGAYVTHCPTPDDRERILLSDEGGVFDLAPSTDGRFLAVSHREARFVELIDLRDGSRRQVGTAQPSDTLFDRTEPETLLALPDGSFLLLAASSDTEQGNLLTHLDPVSGRLSPPLAARGISDVVGDGKGGVWISSEFDGRLARLDPTSGDAPVQLQLPGGAETNKVIVDASSGRAWSVGLWTDPMLRAIDLANGRQINAVHLGTHQWDLALSSSLRRLFVPRFVEGRLHIIDADSLEPLGSLKADFGLRSVEVSPDGSLVLTGNIYTGSVVARSAESGEVRYSRRIGGYIKGLRIGADGRTFAGSVCGVWELGDDTRAGE
jgi:WD40 repeat protein